MHEGDAIEALEHLGLTSYEAQVFVALQKLGTGSASDIDRIADIPRSQVYGAAEKLEERGLVEVQQSNPIRYRAVSQEEARERLRNRYQDREEEAFDYLEEVRAQGRDPDERQEDVWTIHGRESATRRAIQLVSSADESVVYAGDADVFDDELLDELVDCGNEGVDVTVVSTDEAVIEMIENEGPISAVTVPPELEPEDDRMGRILVVDDDTVLMSVLGEDALPEMRTETAIWSAETGFASVFVRMFRSMLDEHLAR